MDEIYRLIQIVPSQRILLLPHCLRRSNTCKAKYNEEGLQCIHCNPECSVNRLSTAAAACGYGGICVAPGGKLAIKYISKIRPQAIVAIACDKELEEGIQGVNEIKRDDNIPIPLMVVIPLLKDGCVDTEVDEKAAIEAIQAGCTKVSTSKMSGVFSG